MRSEVQGHESAASPGANRFSDFFRQGIAIFFSSCSSVSFQSHPKEVKVIRNSEKVEWDLVLGECFPFGEGQEFAFP